MAGRIRAGEKLPGGFLGRRRIELGRGSVLKGDVGKAALMIGGSLQHTTISIQ